MTDMTYKVELVKGDFRAVIEGDKDFVSQKLDTVIEFAKFEPQSVKAEPIFRVMATPGLQGAERAVDERQSPVTPTGGKLEQAVGKLCISHVAVSSYVYLGEDGTPRIMRPDALPLQDAILLTCALAEETKNEKVHDHVGTKKRLEKDRVDTTRWRDSLVKLRNEGLIKDVGDKERFRDFELTPRAFTELRSKFGAKAEKDSAKSAPYEQTHEVTNEGASGEPVQSNQ